MKNRLLPQLLSVLACALPLSAFAAPWTMVPNSIISISNVKTYCYGEQPVVDVTLLINAGDRGRPGLIYVGSHDPDQIMGEIYTPAGWEVAQSPTLPIYAIVRGGLSNRTLTIPLNNPSMKVGWSLYVGYGALTVHDENLVQSSLAAVAKVKREHPERRIPAVDPDYQRQVLVQQDMTKNVKYRFVRKWTPDLITMCQSYGGGN